MKIIRRPPQPIVRAARAAVWLVCAVVVSGSVHAEDDVVVAEEVVHAEPEVYRFDARQAAAQVASHVAHYEGTVFLLTHTPQRAPRTRQNPPQRSVRGRVEGVLDRWIGHVDAACELTEPQRLRLREALRSDVEPAVALIEADIARYKAMQFEGRDFKFVQQVQQQLNEDAVRAREMLMRAFDGDSLLFKILPTTVTAEQHDRLMADFAARRAGRWAAAVAMVLVSLDRTVGLTARQHAALERVLLARQPTIRIYPPNASDIGELQALVWIELADEDEDELKAIFTERQWAVLADRRQACKHDRPHIVKQGWYEP